MISVIIPTYNRAHTLPRALDSVLAQTRPADEIIVIDDGSTDGTEALLKQHYPQIMYLHQENNGVSAARNYGIKKATGDWLALLDSDDEWLPHKLATQMNLLEQQADYKFIHSNEIWVRNGVRVNQMDKHAKQGGWIFQHCLPLCAISPSAVIIHQDLFKQHGQFNESLPACEDYELWLRITAYHPVLYCEEPLIIKYGGHDDQLSQQYWGMDRFRIQALIYCLENVELSETDRTAAHTMLKKKLRILIKGAEKHDNQDVLAQFKPLYQRWN